MVKPSTKNVPASHQPCLVWKDLEEFDERVREGWRWFGRGCLIRICFAVSYVDTIVVFDVVGAVHILVVESNLTMSTRRKGKRRCQVHRVRGAEGEERVLAQLPTHAASAAIDSQ